MEAQKAGAKLQRLVEGARNSEGMRAAQPVGGAVQFGPPGTGATAPSPASATQPQAAGEPLVLGPHSEPWTLPGADPLGGPSQPMTPPTRKTVSTGAPLAGGPKAVQVPTVPGPCEGSRSGTGGGGGLRLIDQAYTRTVTACL